MLDEKYKLDNLRVPSLPNTIYYIPNFITPEEERHILASLPPNRWINLSHRRLQAHPSTLAPRTNALLASPLPKWLCEPITSRFEQLGLFSDSPHKSPNHVLVNEYKAGEGIMPHEDGDAYYPIVATVSLGASVVLDLYDKRRDDESHTTTTATAPPEQQHLGQKKPRWRVLQEPRSLLVTTGSAYTDLLHGIAEFAIDEDLTSETVANWDLLGDAAELEDNGSRNDRGTRTSLTYRDVLKVSRVGSCIFGKSRG